MEDITACVIDHGQFLPVALRLAEQYGRVCYFTPTEKGMPDVRDAVVGDGFENIRRVGSFFEALDYCDLFVFPDVGFEAEQEYLTRHNRPVWGHRGADILESNRGEFLEVIRRLGMDVPEFDRIIGLAALREYLKDKTDKWIKCSRYRGNWETFHWRSWEEDAGALDRTAYLLGLAMDLLTFYVFNPIEAEFEDGIDTYNIGGKFPRTVLHGMEHKDRAYLCGVQPLEGIDDRVRQVADVFGPVLGRYDYSGFFSCEVRVQQHRGFFTDPTCRAASPSSQVMMELFENIGEIIAEGAHGRLVEPMATGKYGIQALLSVDREPDEPVTLKIPESIRRWTKISYAASFGENLYVPPNQLGNMLGWLCATGDTVDEALQSLKQYAKELPSGINCDMAAVAELLLQTEEAKHKGLEIVTGEVPEPQEAIA